MCSTEVALARRPQLAVELLSERRQVPLQRIAHEGDALLLDTAAPAGGFRVADHVRRHAEDPADFLDGEQPRGQHLGVFLVDAELRRLQPAGEDERRPRPGDGFPPHQRVDSCCSCSLLSVDAVFSA